MDPHAGSPLTGVRPGPGRRSKAFGFCKPGCQRLLQLLLLAFPPGLFFSQRPPSSMSQPAHVVPLSLRWSAPLGSDMHGVSPSRPLAHSLALPCVQCSYSLNQLISRVCVCEPLISSSVISWARRPYSYDRTVTAVHCAAFLQAVGSEPDDLQVAK